MLTPPSKGFGRSVDAHNVELDAMADWLEGCITFVDTEIPQSDVKDVLGEENLYPKQEFAQERIEDVWAELRRRVACLGPAATYRVEGHRLERMFDGRTVPLTRFASCSRCRWPTGRASRKSSAPITPSKGGCSRNSRRKFSTEWA